MKQKASKPIPDFKSEAEEWEFWQKADSSEYFDYSQAKVAVFPNLKPTRQPISLRVPKSLLVKIKTVANKRDIPYQSLIKTYLTEAVNREWRAAL